MNFGLYYEKAIFDKKIKKAEVARKIDITRQTLSTNIEQWKARRDPNIKTIKKYLDALDIDIKNFFNSM